MNKLYFTIGLPRSGKSTFARHWQRGEVEIRNDRFTIDELSSDEVCRINNVPRVVVTPDAWRLALGHRYNWFVEPVVFSHVQVAVRALLNDYDVLVDDTHTSVESIKRILEIDSTAEFAFVDTPVDICIARAKDCGQSDLEPVIRRMHGNRSWITGQIFENFNGLRDRVESHSSRKVII